MSFDSRREFITSTFQAGFVDPDDATKPFVAVGYENRPFAQPQKATWGKFSVRENTRGAATVGKDENRTRGFIYLQLFTPENDGTKKAREAAQKLAEIFEHKVFAGPAGQFTFRAVNWTTVGREPGGFYQFNATCEFWHDEPAT